MAKPLAIVGIDPGTTAAYTLIDLEGRFLGSYSSKEFSLAQMLARVFEQVTPVLCATDKAKCPTFVEDFARKSGAIVYAPAVDLLRYDKRKLVLTIEEELSNIHEEDALACALECYKHYQSRLAKIKRYIVDHHIEEQTDSFTLIALREGLHFDLIKEMLKGTTISDTLVRKAVVEKRITQKDFVALYEKFLQVCKVRDQLSKKIEELIDQNKQLEKERGILERRDVGVDAKVQRVTAVKQRQVNDLSKQNQEQRMTLKGLTRKIESLFAFIENAPRYQLVKKMNSLSLQELALLRKRGFVKGDYVWCDFLASYSKQVLSTLAS